MSKPTPAFGTMTTAPTVLPFAYPLDEFYAQAGLVLPRIECIPSEEMPEPARQLLAHEKDMTPTLEAFFKTPLQVKVLRRHQRDDSYSREVVLLPEEGGAPVEFGAIKIHLGLFPPSARRMILDEHVPLGSILKKCSMAHTSRPKAMLRIVADAFIASVLETTPGTILFGRRNTLLDSHHHSFAEIVEILPPVG